MNNVKISKVISYLIALLYLLGLWNRDSRIRIQLLHAITYSLYLLSMIIGAATNDSRDQSIFLSEMGIIVLVAAFKYWFLIWRKAEIVDILERACNFSVPDNATLMLVKAKRKTITDLAIFLFVTLNVACFSAAIVVPFLRSERKLFFDIALPFDWKNNEAAFWIASLFIFMGAYYTLFSVLMSILIWYSMLNCSLRYEVLGNELKNMGKVKCLEGADNEREMSAMAKQTLFQQDLTNAVDLHQNIRKLTSDMSSLFSNFFFLQIVTGSLSICGSIYCLIFVGKGYVELIIHIESLLYNIAEIFMIARLSNEIRLSSDRLSYCLFESEWIDEPSLIRKNILTFTGLLQRPHVLVVGKLFPLTLELFTKILNLSYSIFNILLTLK